MKIFHLLRLIEMILAIIGLVLVLLIVIIVALFDSEDAFEKSSASLPNAFTNQQFNSGPFELIMGFAVLYMKSLLVSVFLVIVLFCSFTFFVTREMMSKCERFENNGCHQATKEFHEFNDIGESRA
jgi:amino acid transporter